MSRDELELRLRMKQELRRQMSSVRTRTPEEARRARSAAIVARLTSLAAWKAARSVAAYVAMPTEVDVVAAVDVAQTEGKQILFPRVDEATNELTLHSVGDFEETAFGCKQPTASAPRADLANVDLVVCPALAVDPRGYRIGWGKGYYDRLLARMPGTTSVGVIFDFQVIPDAPHTEGDVPVRWLVTDVRVIDCRAEDTL